MFLVLFYISIRSCVARYLICVIGVFAGEKGSFGIILEQREAVHKNGWNVATSQRRDVPTS